MAPMRYAALHNKCRIGYSEVGRINWSWTMGFQTELFSRPRPSAQAHYRAALALLHAMCKADRNDPGVRPADFPRLSRAIAAR